LDAGGAAGGGRGGVTAGWVRGTGGGEGAGEEAGARGGDAGRGRVVLRAEGTAIAGAVAYAEGAAIDVGGDWISRAGAPSRTRRTPPPSIAAIPSAPIACHGTIAGLRSESPFKPAAPPPTAAPVRDAALSA